MEDKSYQEIIKGDEADRILNSEVYKHAIESVRKGVVDAMGQSPMGDDKTHNRLVIALQLINQIEKNLTTVMQTGKMARIQIEGNVVHKLRGIA